MYDEQYNTGFKRIRYSQGLILSESDFKDEQNYHISKRRFFNQCMYGTRIVCGLEVELARHNVLVHRGLCLDCCGREVFIPDKVKGPLPKNEGTSYLVVLYKEIPVDPVPVPKPPVFPGENAEHSRILESYELFWQAENPLLGHELKDGGWQACGDSHPVPIAAIFKQRNSFKLIDYKKIEKEHGRPKPSGRSRRK